LPVHQLTELAINGGKPVRKKPFPSWPIFGKAEEKALIEVLRSGKWGIGGEKNVEFSQAYAKWLGVRRVVTCTNGTAAIEIALRAVGVKPADEVIVPSYTFVATASSVLSIGAVPVFADIEPETYMMDPDSVEAVITPKTKAIIPVYIGGGPADLDRILKIARDRDLRVVEDAAQAHGAEWNGKRIGGDGDIAIWSFQSSKNLTAGEGGAMSTNNEEIGEDAWSIMNCGRRKDRQWYEHFILGSNFRMTEFQAAILLKQLAKVEGQMKIRDKNATYLAKRLKEVEGIAPLEAYPQTTRHAHHLFIMRYDQNAFGGVPKEKFVKTVNKEGIPLAPGYTIPLHELPAIRNYSLPYVNLDYSTTKLPVTEHACKEEGMWFHQSVLLGTRRDMDDIVDALLKVKKHSNEPA
jgi:dTDP-4-amino-4,6-dideoxygalactose transaminase